MCMHAAVGGGNFGEKMDRKVNKDTHQSFGTDKPKQQLCSATQYSFQYGSAKLQLIIRIQDQDRIRDNTANSDKTILSLNLHGNEPTKACCRTADWQWQAAQTEHSEEKKYA
ncbi:hypothetical protein U9M48_010069, partial [Paspalum notatum var. saurae]